MRTKPSDHLLLDEDQIPALNAPPLLRAVRDFATFRDDHGGTCSDAAGLQELWHAVPRNVLAVRVTDSTLPTIGRTMRDEADEALRAGPRLLRRLQLQSATSIWLEHELHGPNAAAIPFSGTEPRPHSVGALLQAHPGRWLLRAARADASRSRGPGLPSAPVTAPLVLDLDPHLTPAKFRAAWTGWAARCGTDPRVLNGDDENDPLAAMTDAWERRHDLLTASLGASIAFLGPWRQLAAVLARQVTEGSDQRFPALPLIVLATLLALERGTIATSVRGVIASADKAARDAEELRAAKAEKELQHARR